MAAQEFKAGQRVYFVCQDQRDSALIGRKWYYVRLEENGNHRVQDNFGSTQYFTHAEISATDPNL